MNKNFNKQFLLLLLILLCIIICGCGANSTSSGSQQPAATAVVSDSTSADTLPEEKAETAKPIGCIMVGDKNDTYSHAYVDGIVSAAKKCGIDSEMILWYFSTPGDTSCYDAAVECVQKGCGLVISNSPEHQDYMYIAAKENPDVIFVAMGGDYAAVSGLNNYKNAATNIYEARFITGALAGYKINSHIQSGSLKENNYSKNGEIHVGYIGNYKTPQCISDMTAFYLGMKYTCENDIAMDVIFTESPVDYDKEYAIAEDFIQSGCVIIGSYGDCEAMPTAVQLHQNYGNRDADNGVCNSVCFNIDMLHVGYDTFLASATNHWNIYFQYLFSHYLKGEDIAADWSEGLKSGAVGLSTLGRACAGDSQAQIKELTDKINSGTIRVFDTATFTIDGESLSSYEVDLSKYNSEGDHILFPGKKMEAITTSDGISFFNESAFRSAPYFDMKIDGINWLN